MFRWMTPLRSCLRDEGNHYLQFRFKLEHIDLSRGVYGNVRHRENKGVRTANQLAH